MTIANLTDFAALKPEIYRPLAQTKLAQFIDFLMFGMADQFPIGAGETVPVPSFGELSGDVDISKDKNDIEVNGITPLKDIGVVCHVIKAFGAEDLIKIVTGLDPNAEIATQVARYFAKNAVQKRMLSVLKGLFSAAGPLYTSNRYSKYADVATTHSTYAVMTPTIAALGVQKLGDEMDKIVAWIMHSKVVADLRAQGFVTDLPANNPFGFGPSGILQTFNGKPISMSDTCTTISGTTSDLYRSYAVTRGAFAIGIQKDLNPELDRDKLNKKSYISTDLHFMPHVRGVSYVGATGNGEPTVAHLEAGASWSLSAENAKFVGVVAIDTN